MINDPAPQGEPDMAALAGAAGISSLSLQALSGMCFVGPVCLYCTSCICLSMLFFSSVLVIATSSCCWLHRFPS